MRECCVMCYEPIESDTCYIDSTGPYCQGCYNALTEEVEEQEI